MNNVNNKVSSSKCRVHGYTEDVIKIQYKWYRCKACYKNYNNKYYSDNKEEISRKAILYQKTVIKQRREARRKEFKESLHPHSNCKKHGYTEDVYKTGATDRFGYAQYRCRQCCLKYLQYRYQLKKDKSIT